MTMLPTVLFAVAATIGLPPSPSDVEQFAAEELRHWVKETSGEEWRVADGASSGVRVHIGRAAAEKLFPDDLKALEGTFGYALRRRGDDCYLFGATPKGTLNAVYGFLERNTDIIWARPQFTVYTKRNGFTISACDALEKPKSTALNWLFTIAGFDERDLLWQARNGGSFARMPLNASRRFAPLAGKLGMKIEKGGHIFRSVLDSGLFKTHPEYWAEVNGTRKVSAPALCLTNPGLADVYRECLFKWIDKAQPLDTLVLGMNDSYDMCTCSECLKPIRLPDGGVITQDDPSFKSTRWYQFVNPIADAVKAKYGIETAVYAYFYLTKPPKVKISDNIVVIYHPVPRQMGHAYDRQTGEVCPDWSKLMEEYDRRCEKGMRLREYYGCVGVYPTPLEYVAQDDARFCLKRGIYEFSAETPVDHHDVRFREDPEWHWDSHAISTWCTQRLWWNPDVDIESLRDMFLSRTYHGAAPAMKKYYDRTRDLWRKVETRQAGGSLDQSLGRRCIVKSGAEEELRGYLKEAEAAADHPTSAELVRRARKVFERLCGSANRISAGKVAGVPTTADWSAAPECREFVEFGHKERPVTRCATVRLLHDDQNLYVRFVQTNAVPGDIVAIRLAATAEAKPVMRLERAKAAMSVWTTDMVIPFASLGLKEKTRVGAVFYNRCGGRHLTLRSLPLDNPRFYPDVFLED